MDPAQQENVKYRNHFKQLLKPASRPKQNSQARIAQSTNCPPKKEECLNEVEKKYQNELKRALDNSMADVKNPNSRFQHKNEKHFDEEQYNTEIKRALNNSLADIKGADSSQKLMKPTIKSKGKDTSKDSKAFSYKTNTKSPDVDKDYLDENIYHTELKRALKNSSVAIKSPNKTINSNQTMKGLRATESHSADRALQPRYGMPLKIKS